MVSITLIKYHPCYQLGHLYEHLFMASLKKFFYDRHLYKMLDYFAYATTYEDGVIEIFCEIYTKEAAVLVDKLSDLQIDLGIDNIEVSKALQSMMAEEPWQLYVTDKRKLLDGVRELDALPWQTPHSMQLIDTLNIRRKNTPIYITAIDAPKPRKIHLSLRLDDKFVDSRRDILPLFNIVGHWLNRTMADQAALHFGAYVGDASGRRRPMSASIELFAIKALVSEMSAGDVVKYVHNVAQHMVTQATLDRMVVSLTSSIKSENNDTMPDMGRILMETGIYMSYEDLLAGVCSDAIRDILQHCTLVVQYGRKKIMQQLAVN
jgi:hypothetical protein